MCGLASGKPRVPIIWANFHRYRRIAEDLHAEPWNPKKAAKTRTVMGRRTGGALTPVELAVLTEEWQRRRGKPDAVYEMAAERGIHRTTLWRQIKKAEELGFL